MSSTNLVARALVLAGLVGALSLPRTTRAQSVTPERALVTRLPAVPSGAAGVNRVCGSGTFSTPFGGVAANGKDLMWTGAAADQGVPREMLILLADKGPAVESNRPVWEVEGIVFVSGAPEESFAADVDGTIDWKRGRMVLRGRITAGHLDGAAFEQTAELQQLDLRGQWRAERVVAAK